MNSLLRRFSFYFLGLAIGSILVWNFMIKNRNDLPKIWPNEKVIDTILNATFTPNNQSFCVLNCIQLSPENLKPFIQNATVEFNKSKPRQYPQIYHLTGKYPKSENHKGPHNTIGLEIVLSDSLFQLNQAYLDNKIPCECP
jgi:hypothetical protein